MGKKKVPLVEQDIWLEPHEEVISERLFGFERAVSDIKSAVGSIKNMSLGHKFFGFNRGEKEGRAGVWYREWAPGAVSLALAGEFNNWERFRNPMKRDEFGVWSVFLPDEEYSKRLIHKGKVKVSVFEKGRRCRDRIPAYIRRVEQGADGDLVGVYWNPKHKYKWRAGRPKTPNRLKIYEAHVGMATEEGKIGTFDEFTQDVLPRIGDLGYNAVQLMAVAEHPYYASFGYQVSNFFAVSQRFGEPEGLKNLVDDAHRMGLLVIMDVVHSHSVSNTDSGLNMFDGSDHQYFHSGARGDHPLWKTKLFDYGKFEVQRFLLSNLRFWLEEFRIDGFRFDGVTSMLYMDHGVGRSFTSYRDYFTQGAIDEDALLYLQLSNHLVHSLRAQSITIAEDVSGFPGLARPIAEGGVGFDYRLAMGIADYWIELLKDRRDEDWSVGEMVWKLGNHRPGEKHISYCESHDQALVGDKTIAFRLMDELMYTHMHKKMSHHKIDRGMALHKMIRLATLVLGGSGYLNFMGNEFGHPEWIDFPRPGNNNSYHYARRQWSLVQDESLRYKQLWEFDRAMLELEEKYELLAQTRAKVWRIDEEGHIFVLERGGLVFVFNFHPDRDAQDLKLGELERTKVRILLSSDDGLFGGAGREVEVKTESSQRDSGVFVDSHSRTALILEVS